MRDYEAGARRVYELQRKAEVKRRHEGPIPTWEQLDWQTRSGLVASHRDLMRLYDAGRPLPAESRLRQTDH